MSSQVACAISEPPGTIHGTTPTPFGNTTMHSVMAFHRARVMVRASSGITNDSAMTFCG